MVEKYGQVDAVKVVYDLRSETLYFLNGKQYPYHYSFCSEYLNDGTDLAYFNDHNYRNSPKRKYLLGNLNYFKAQERYVLEISASDTMDENAIRLLHQQVVEHTFIKEQLYFLLNSLRLQQEKKTIGKGLPVITPSEVFEQLRYQPIAQYRGKGRLRFIDTFEKEKDAILPTDIIVLRETPVYLPEVAGILVSEFQTPLSHLSILGTNRKIPIAAYKNLSDSKTLRSFEGKWVSYEVRRDTFLIAPSKRKPKRDKRTKNIKIPFDLGMDSLTAVPYLPKKAERFVGNKAANFGRLYQLGKTGGFRTPEGAFTVPFYYYEQHARTSGAQQLLNELFASAPTNTDKDSVRQRLKRVRKMIAKAPIASGLLAEVERKILANGTYRRMRFRSSTNAEDTKNFSGAGLYTSKTGELGNPKKSVERAIKKVWASLWSYRAFMERELYGIPHQQVYMGILVHRSFPSEAVNGVAITKNLYRKDSEGFVVNAQLGNENVVAPDPQTTSDQFMCYPKSADALYKNTVNIITTSSLNQGKLTMDNDEIKRLANALETVKKYFHKKVYRSKPYPALGLDIEFKLDGDNRTLYLKQVRLHND